MPLIVKIWNPYNKQRDLSVIHICIDNYLFTPDIVANIKNDGQRIHN